MQIRKKFPNEGMDRETKAVGKIGLIKTNLIGVRMISPLFVTWDPNFYRVRELEPIPNSLLVSSRKGTRDVPGFIMGGNRSGLRDHTVIRRG